MFSGVAFIIPLLSFFLQSYSCFWNRQFGIDIWTRLIEIDLVRKNGHSVRQKITGQFIIDGFFDYPPLFPFLLSFISKKNLEQIQGFVAPFFDAIHSLVIYSITYHITHNVYIALVAQLMYMLTPIIALENSYLTPRSFGYLNLTLTLYPLLLYTTTGSHLALILAFFFATVLFLSHRFALQSFFFFILFLTFFEGTLFYILFFMGALFAALLMTKGYYITVLRGHLANIYFWALNYRYRFAHQIRGLQIKKMKRDFIDIMYAFFRTFTPVTLLGTNIWILAVLILFVGSWFHIPIFSIESLLLQKMILWVLFYYGFAISVLSIPQLIPVGEGQRYLEMATAPTVILSSILFFTLLASPYRMITLIIVFFLLIINAVIILLVQYQGIIRDKNRSLTEDLKRAFKFLNTVQTPIRILCIPHYITTMTIYHTKADVLVNADTSGLLKIMDIFPVLKKPIPNLVQHYNLNYLILNETFCTLDELHLDHPTIAFRSGNVVVVHFH